MLPVRETPDVIEAREELKEYVDKLREEGKSDKKIAKKVENRTFGTWKLYVHSMFDDTHSLAQFIGVKTNCFDSYFMH